MEPDPEVWPAEAGDFYNHLTRNERPRSPIKDSRERKLCVSWITRACSDYGFSPDTGGLAVEYFDAMMAQCRRLPDTEALTFKQLVKRVGATAVDVSRHKESQLCELICIVCISIAAKKVEAKEKAPFLGDFDEHFTFQELRAMERLVLDSMQWNLNCSTVFDFVHFWTQQASRDVDRVELKRLCMESIAMCMKESEFSDKSARVFGAAVTIWAHDAKSWSAVEIRASMSRLMGSQEDADIVRAVEHVGFYLKQQYPHAFKPRRAESPTTTLEFTNTVIGYCDEAAKQGLKRPTPMQPRSPVMHSVKKIKADDATMPAYQLDSSAVALSN